MNLFYGDFMVNLVKGLSNEMIKILRNFKNINSALIAITKVVTVLGFAFIHFLQDTCSVVKYYNRKQDILLSDLPCRYLIFVTSLLCFIKKNCLKLGIPKDVFDSYRCVVIFKDNNQKKEHIWL